MSTPDLGAGRPDAGRKMSSVVCIVIGGLWILLTGACSEAVFAGMPARDKLTLELLLTLPGCVVVLAGLTMRLNAAVSGLIVLAYAALLSFMFTQGVLGSGGASSEGLFQWLVFANAPSICLALWGVLLLRKSGKGET
jgi:uncharacterized SAM-binding protein YcdF (DUF218 family)